MVRQTTALPGTDRPDTAVLVEKSRQPALGKHADRTLNGLVRKLEAAVAAAGDDADLAAALRRVRAEVKRRLASNGADQAPRKAAAGQQAGVAGRDGKAEPRAAVSPPRMAPAAAEDMPDLPPAALRLGGSPSPDVLPRAVTGSGVVERSGKGDKKDSAAKAAEKADAKARKEAEKAERKRVRQAEKAERKRVKEAEKSERKAARKAERKASKLAAQKPDGKQDDA
ncbi:hypothetical protein [Paracoccus contaminans]|uniref:hypothetical protein n=1 Tax=Paracoccus contaminans TaxID=1945662 RepID=UPI0012F4F340|nr:hypothetical protein [Paracoccus contaminans]